MRSSSSGSAPPPESRLGTVIQGEYHVEVLRGEDELGPIYEAQNPRRKGRFRVLMLRREISPPLKTMLAVRDELRRARELAPMGVLPTEQLADAQGTPGFATEILAGETLRQRLGRGAMQVEQALALIRVLGRALDALHAAGLVHGDLRPENVLLVDPEAKGPHAGRALLIGHALHRLRRRGRAMDVDRLRYCPPELLAGEAETPGPRGDVFALGALLYECLTGAPAFPGATAEAVAQQLAQPQLSLPADQATGLSVDRVRTLNVVLAGACARDPQARVPRAAELVDALGQVARGAGLAWPEEGTGQREISIVRRLSGMFARQPPRPAATPSAGGAAATRSRSGPSELVEAAPQGDLEVLQEEQQPEQAPPGQPPGREQEHPAHRRAPPPLPAAAARTPSGRPGHGAPPQLKDPRLLQESTVLLFRTEQPDRPVRATDLSSLVVAVQEGRMDPITAVQQAQRGEEVGLLQRRLQPVLRLISEHPQAVLVALAGAFLLAVVLLLARCLR